MRKITKLLAVSALSLAAMQSQADEASIRKALGDYMPGEKIDTIKPSEIPGLYEVTVGASVFYASEEGKYLLQGQLFDAAAKKNITETKLAGVRKAALDKMGAF